MKGYAGADGIKSVVGNDDKIRVMLVADMPRLIIDEISRHALLQRNK